MIRGLRLNSRVLLAMLAVGAHALGAPQATTFAQTGLNVIINQVESSGFPEVKAYVTVSDQNGLPIGDLTSTSFEVVEDGKSVAAVQAESILSDVEPLALAIALDLSGSMTGRPLADTLAATAELIAGLGPADEIALITFSDNASVVVPLTKDKVQVTDALNTLTARGGTALWDAVHQANQILAVRPAGRRAVIVVTDGQDTGSLLRLTDVAGEASRQHLPVFPIGFGAIDQAALGRLAELTGGSVFIAPTSDQLAAQFRDILERLRQQYVLTFSSTALADGAEHRLTVRVRHLGAQAEGTAAFVATPIEVTVALPALSDGEQVGIGIPTRLVPEFPPLAAIRSVEYLLDDVTLATATAPPFEFTWTPAQSDLGSRTLTVRAVDAVGSVTERTVPIEIVPPVAVSIILPREADVISGTVTLEVEVTALSAVSSVDFRIDGKSVGTAAGAPYTLEWDSASVPAGDHELRVVVTDINGQSANARMPIHVQVGINWGLFGAIALVLISIGVIVPMSLRSRRTRMAASRAVARSKADVPVDGGAAAAGAQLILEAGDGKGQTWALVQEETRIGRQRTENDVILSGRDVSRRHAVIRLSGSAYVFVNLSQTGASHVNGQAITNERPLADGDVIQIGDFALRFVRPK